MKPYEQRTKTGKILSRIWQRIFGGDCAEMTPLEIAVRVVDVLKRIVNNPKLSAYTEATKGKLDDQVLGALKKWLPKIAQWHKVIPKATTDWQADLQDTANGLRARIQSGVSWSEWALMVHQEVVRERGGSNPRPAEARELLEAKYQQLKASELVA